MKRYNKQQLQDLPIGTHVTIHNSEDNNDQPFQAIIQLAIIEFSYDHSNMKVVHPTEPTTINHSRFKKHNQHSLNENEYATINSSLPNDLFEV